MSGRFGLSHPDQILHGWDQDTLDEAHRALDFREYLENPDVSS